MATKFLILLGLLAAVSLAASDCGSKYFQCKDGSKCVIAADRCDGRKECRDGSDEEGCDVHTVALRVNATIKARMQFAAVHENIELHLCGAQSCSNVLLWGVRDDGTLIYTADTDANRLGRGNSRRVTFNTAGSGNFTPGEVVLEVQHRPGQLAVWRQGRPDDVAEVPVEADYGTLRVRPYVWSTDMPVQFAAAGESWPEEFFHCNDDRSRVPGVFRCDGNSDCSDGSDEEGCDAMLAAHEVALPLNASATARVQYAKVHNDIEVHLCGGKNCSVVLLWGESANGSLRYDTATGCTRYGRLGNSVKENRGSGPDFSPGEVVLEVQHRPGQLAVWRQGRPDDVVEVPVGADYGTLRVRPFYWVADMPVQFTSGATTAMSNS
ncbi:low-density lipoprotein receptor-related protein 2-like [Thrips palmi]|uniref:Low-density lipoprotein receptor-related protein 2-like n=1 Tax=Thrips palmi TaxID=161013 RepID=A0A6P9A516_THRPL|nr:low-density lipoprotein receptor-related protein 2-like [Thrips palmi]